jgi:hypothetical protein
MTQNINSRISIQVSLSGYSFKVYDRNGLVSSSDWNGAGSVFTNSEFQNRYDKVDISVFTPKCTLVPSQFFNPSSGRFVLADVCQLKENDVINFVEVPQFNSVLVYSQTTGEILSSTIANTVLCSDGNKGSVYPETFYLLDEFMKIDEYNKIIASYYDGHLYLVIGQGKTLLLCNTFEAVDFTTAQYFIFLALKKLQLNPEVSSIYFRTPLGQEEEMSLYRYFKAVERI